MSSFRSAFLGSGIATFVVTSIMAEKTAMGLLPQFSIAKSWAGVVGMPEAAWVGWLIHIVVGIVAGGAIFALIYDKLFSSYGILKGMVFGLASWVLMMLVFMPLAGVGIFALQAGSKVLLFTLVLSLVYGTVLGGVYAWDKTPAQAGSKSS
jgi:hypothetical protein